MNDQAPHPLISSVFTDRQILISTIGTTSQLRSSRTYAKGRHSFMRGSMVSWTSAAFPSFRFRFELFEEARWRSPGLRRSNLPVAVTLNRLATAFLVLRRATGFGMGLRTVHWKKVSATFFGKKVCAMTPHSTKPPEGGRVEMPHARRTPPPKPKGSFFYFLIGVLELLRDTPRLNCYQT